MKASEGLAINIIEIPDAEQRAGVCRYVAGVASLDKIFVLDVFRASVTTVGQQYCMVRL